MKNIGEYTFLPSKLRIVHPKNDQGKRIRLTPEEMLVKYPCYKAFIAAPMFNHTGVGKCGSGGLTPCTRQLDLETGVDFPSCRPQSGISFSFTPRMPPGEVFISVDSLDRFHERSIRGIQLYPTLVYDGKIRGKREKVSSVAGLGIQEDRSKLLYLVASGGTLKDLADLFLEKGCNYAGYTDAGSSAALYVVGEGYKGIHAKKPSLPAWLCVEE